MADAPMVTFLRDIFPVSRSHSDGAIAAGSGAGATAGAGALAAMGFSATFPAAAAGVGTTGIVGAGCNFGSTDFNGVSTAMGSVIRDSPLKKRTEARGQKSEKTGIQVTVF
jgi:hypothetical protein